MSLPPPSAEEVASLTERIARRITKRVRKLLQGEEERGSRLEETVLSMESSLLRSMRVPVADRAGLFDDADHESETSASRPSLCTKWGGFSLHAGRCVSAEDRESLERLCRDGLRAPFSQDRLTMAEGLEVGRSSGRGPVVTGGAIPGGLEEKPGTESLVSRIQGTLRRSRERESGGPVMNGVDGRMPKGGRLAAMSNAGFECVAIADNLGAMTLADLTPETHKDMQSLLDENRLSGIVSVHHPWDVTPMINDAAFAAAAHILIADNNVDIGMIGCVPLTPALHTQEPKEGWSDDLTGRTDIVARLIQLWESSTKPWVAVVEGGEEYDPMARALQRHGVPTFRSIDRAMKAVQLLLRDQGVS